VRCLPRAIKAAMHTSSSNSPHPCYSSVHPARAPCSLHTATAFAQAGAWPTQAGAWPSSRRCTPACSLPHPPCPTAAALRAGGLPALPARDRHQSHAGCAQVAAAGQGALNCGDGHLPGAAASRGLPSACAFVCGLLLVCCPACRWGSCGGTVCRLPAQAS